MNYKYNLVIAISLQDIYFIYFQNTSHQYLVRYLKKILLKMIALLMEWPLLNPMMKAKTLKVTITSPNIIQMQMHSVFC